MRFHGIVMLDRRRIDLVDLDLGLLQSTINVAKTQIARYASVTAGIRRREASDEVELGSFLFVLSTNQRSSIVRLMKTLRHDHSNGLVVVVDQVILQKRDAIFGLGDFWGVSRLENRYDARCTFCLCRIHLIDLPGGNRALD